MSDQGETIGERCERIKKKMARDGVIVTIENFRGYLQRDNFLRTRGWVVIDGGVTRPRPTEGGPKDE